MRITTLVLAACALALALGLARHGGDGVPPAPASGWQSAAAHSRLVRWLRCARVVHAPLSGTPFNLRYAAIGWRNAAQALDLRIDADGHARVTRARAGDGLAVAELELTRADIDGLAALIDREDLLCAAEVPVVVARPAGAYRRTIEIEAGLQHRVLSVDACYQPNDRIAWDAVVGRLERLLEPSAVPMPAPPAAAVQLERSCNDDELAATGELDRRERELSLRGARAALVKEAK